MRKWLYDRDPRRRGLRTGIQALVGGGFALLFWFVPDEYLSQEMKVLVTPILAAVFASIVSYIQNDVEERRRHREQEFGPNPLYTETPDGSQSVIIVQGDDYEQDDLRMIPWHIVRSGGAVWPPLVRVECHAKMGGLKRSWPVEWQISENKTSLDLSLSLSSAETSQLANGVWSYSMIAFTDSNRRITLLKKSFLVVPKVG